MRYSSRGTSVRCSTAAHTSTHMHRKLQTNMTATDPAEFRAQMSILAHFSSRPEELDSGCQPRRLRPSLLGIIARREFHALGGGVPHRRRGLRYCCLFYNEHFSFSLEALWSVTALAVDRTYSGNINSRRRMVVRRNASANDSARFDQRAVPPREDERD